MASKENGAICITRRCTSRVQLPVLLVIASFCSMVDQTAASLLVRLIFAFLFFLFFMRDRRMYASVSLRVSARLIAVPV